MEKFLEKLSKETALAFKEAGYDESLGKVGISNRPDLCEYQCNGAMAGAKLYKKAPIMIANDVAEKLKESKAFSSVEVCPPGFINLNVSDDFLTEFVKEMATADKYGVEEPAEKKRCMVDYGGPNVAKPLHVGHLRSAVIGESIKRIIRYMGHEAIGEKISEEVGIKYLPTDFKKKNGYKMSIELSKEFNLYRQNYCGCVFSKI